MVSWRFSLARLLCTISLVAVACAALAQPTPLWATITSSSAVAILFYAVLAAIYRSGAQRALWLGMAVVGWSYFVLFVTLGDDWPFASSVLLEWLEDVQSDAWLANAMPSQPALIPASAINPLNSGADGAFDFEIYTASNPPPANPPPAPGSLVPITITPAYDREDFFYIGHSLWTLLFGSIGGLVARRLQKSSQGGHSAHSISETSSTLPAEPKMVTRASRG